MPLCRGGGPSTNSLGHRPLLWPAVKSPAQKCGAEGGEVGLEFPGQQNKPNNIYQTKSYLYNSND